MVFFSKKARRFFKSAIMDLARLAVFAVLVFLACIAICVVVSLPEIIGNLIMG